MGEARNRINNFHKFALLLLAVSMDFMQFFFTFIPVIGPMFAVIFSIIARIVFWVWFKVLHVGFADKANRFMVNIAMSTIEFLPLIDAIPAWTFGTWLLIRQVRKEDKKYNEKIQQKFKASNDNYRQPANDNYKQPSNANVA